MSSFNKLFIVGCLLAPLRTGAAAALGPRAALGPLLLLLLLGTTLC